MDLIKKGLSFGLGLAVTSKEQAEKFVNDLVKKGELSLEESKDMVNQLIQRGEEEKRITTHCTGANQTNIKRIGFSDKRGYSKTGTTNSEIGK